MKTNLIALKLTLALSAIALSAAAQTAPALRLTDGTNTVTVDATGAVTCVGTCSTVSASGTAGNPGNVTWSGTLGGFSVSNAQGNAQTVNSPNPDLSVLATYLGSSSGTLTVSWTSTGYTGPIVTEAIPQTNISEGSGSVTYNYYTDNTNALFGTGSLVGTLAGEITSITGPLWTTVAAGTYSVTLVEAITLSTGAFKGGFYYPDNSKVSFRGVVFQDQTIGAGFFLGPDGSGTVNLGYP